MDAARRKILQCADTQGLVAVKADALISLLEDTDVENPLYWAAWLTAI